jgi:hypothetical protein
VTVFCYRMVQIITINTMKVQDCELCEESTSCCYDHISVPHLMKQDMDVSIDRK